jgi:hypothetical protein
MLSLGKKGDDLDVCVFNKHNKEGVQCSVCVHVDEHEYDQGAHGRTYAKVWGDILKTWSRD